MKSWRLIIPTLVLVIGMALPAATPSSYAAPVIVPAPAAPVNVAAIPGDRSAAVTWESPVIAAIYRLSASQVNVYHNGLPAYPWHVQGAGDLTQLKVSGLTNGVSYTFTVQLKQSTVGSAAQESDWSLPSRPSTAVVPGVPPAAPTNVDVHGAYTTTRLTWTAPQAGTSPTLEYKVTAYRFGQVDTVPTVTYYSLVPTLATVSGLDSYASYTFTVKARNSYGWGPESTPTAPITPNTAVPSAPTITSLVPGDGTLTVSWVGPYMPGIDHYLVLVSREDGTLVTYRDRVFSPVTITGLTNGVKYVVEVRAVDTHHMMSSGTQARAVVGGIAAPANLGAAVGDRSVKLTWDAVTGVDHHMVSIYAVSTMVWSQEHVYANSVSVTGLVNGQMYLAEVRAVGSEGSVSDPARVYFVPATVPSPPLGVTAVAGIGQATVGWSTPASNGGSVITGYIVTASTGVTSEMRTMMVNASTSSVVMTGLIPGRTYAFTVVAVNAFGQSAPTAAISTVTIPSAPGAPLNLSVTTGDESITAIWNAPASNGGMPITGYQVTVWDGVHAPIITSVITTSVTVNGLTNGVTYTVSILAVNAVGIGTPTSVTAIPRNLPPVITAPAALTVDYGDAVNFTVTVANPESTDHLVLSAAGLPTGVTFADLGNGTGRVSGNAEVGAGSYTLKFTANDGHNATVSKDVGLTVVREQAIVRPFATAPLSVVLAKANQTAAGSVTIRAKVWEATDPNGNGDIGEAADITYTLTRVDTGTVYSGKAATSGGGIESALTAKYTFHNIPKGMYVLHIGVGGSYYQGAANAMLAVSSKGVKGTVTGQGRVALHGNEGMATIQLNVKRVASGKLSGQVVYTGTYEGKTVTLKSTSITALVLKGNRAYIQGYGAVNGAGGHQFVVTVVDNHALGTPDRCGLKIIDPSFQTMSDYSYDPVELLSGHLSVLHA